MIGTVSIVLLVILIGVGYYLCKRQKRSKHGLQSIKSIDAESDEDEDDIDDMNDIEGDGVMTNVTNSRHQQRRKMDAIPNDSDDDNYYETNVVEIDVESDDEIKALKY